jgi:glycosyltransferase 2 family protein
MNKKFVLFIKIILTTGILVYIFIKIPFDKILLSVSSANLILLLLVVALNIPVTLLSSFQTKYLTAAQKISISFGEILKIYLTTSFYSSFLPGSITGGAVKWYKFAKYSSRSAAAAVVVFNRYLEIFMTVLIGLLFSLPVVIGSSYKYLIILWIIVFTLLILSYFLLINVKTLKKIQGVINSLKIFPGLKSKLINLIEAMIDFQNLTLKDHLEILVIMFSYHLLSIIALYLIAESVNVSLSIFTFGWIRAAVLIMSMLPISYSGLGVREGIMIYLLSFYNVSPQTAFAISFLSFAKNLTMPFVGGIIELKDFLLGKSYKTVKE